MRGFDGVRFARARADAGLSRGRLAQLAAIKSDETVRRWESGLCNPQVDLLRRALIALNGELTRCGKPKVDVHEVIRIPECDRRLSDWRCLRLFTQPELAARAGIPVPSLTKLEAHERPLSEGAAARLGDALDLPAAVIREAYERNGLVADTEDPLAGC
ncbi:helix-turn-helix domain-containing protein [Nocardia sp. alder85J]|uniref:helix-turn-helix domain-containing protein n=1 Tax=Nocardia sp. alder85J TaxID=2862949 RepID=UPI001CD1B1B1|nr:helix-turn-helix transcriptional regulator [Nocardia sp. alder85J]MCX4099155.1 helix-turn-helix transcriptional regulator [Nocardia sp. alder85J]